MWSNVNLPWSSGVVSGCSNDGFRAGSLEFSSYHPLTDVKWYLGVAAVEAV